MTENNLSTVPGESSDELSASTPLPTDRQQVALMKTKLDEYEHVICMQHEMLLQVISYR